MRTMSNDGVRVAMWSGPRNISTAMMRSWENREDTVVWDEPFYAYYLDRTDLAHPSADEIIAAGEENWQGVVSRVTGPIPEGQSIYFQKHMTHHLLEDDSWTWLDQVSNCFLIRDPIEVIASYVKVRKEVSAYDVGIPQQARIFEYVKQRTGVTPPVLDARDVLLDPRTQLKKMCVALNVPFSERMLSWPPGPRKSDGIWAKHWYGTVRTSTGFVAYQPKNHLLPDHLRELAKECEAYYEVLRDCRL